MFSEGETSDLKYENMEQEAKVEIEEASVNLAYLKKELYKEELGFEEKQYKLPLNFGSMVGESLIEQRNNRDSLIDFLDDEVIMERTTGCIKLEDVKEENKDLIPKNIEQSYFEMIQCHYCKMWLETQEHLESHMLHCLENYNILSNNISDLQRQPADTIHETQGNDEKSTAIDENRSSLILTEVIHSKCSDGIDKANKKEIVKNYECSECSYQTNYKHNFIGHLNKHQGIKPFECDICKNRYAQKAYLKVHILNKHTNTIEKEYKCTECSYQTNVQTRLKTHLNTHNDNKPFECDICKKGFNEKSRLKFHLLDKHSNTSEKKYKCSQCSYQANNKGNLKSHLNTHNNKRFECDVCKKLFNQNSHLKKHIKTIHSNTGDTLTQETSPKEHIRNQYSNTSEEGYRCPYQVCHYQTNYKTNFKLHLNTHNDVKPFECDICKTRFTQTSSLKGHIRKKHSNKSEK